MVAAGSGWIPAAAAAGDWPQWRGPNRDAVAVGLDLPAKLPANLTLRWELEVGEGDATPVVIGNRAYVFARKGEEELVVAVDLTAGKELWRQGYAAAPPATVNGGGHTKGPRSTPAYADGRLVTFGSNGMLSCWDVKTHRRIWQNDFVKRFEHTAPPGGATMSPLVDGEHVIAHVGGQSHGALLALDLKTGAEAWSCPGEGPGHASPILATLSSVRQVITQTQSAAVGVDAESGKQLWRIPYGGEPSLDTVTPILDEDSILFSGYNRGLERYRIEQQEEKWRYDKIWDNKEVSIENSAPVVNGERLFGYSHRQKGQFFGLDVTAGQTLWTGDGKQAESASLVRAGDSIWALTTRGELVVFRDSEKQFAPVARYEVSSAPTWAAPVLFSHGVLIKNETQLRFWSFEPPAGARNGS
jgi:outer membrane protein assembly factor BamB